MYSTNDVRAVDILMLKCDDVRESNERYTTLQLTLGIKIIGVRRPSGEGLRVLGE